MAGMQRCLALLALVCLMLSGAPPLQAAQPSDIATPLEIPRLTFTPTFDGSCADYANIGSQPYDNGLVYLAHDGAYLYVCIQTRGSTFKDSFAAVYLDKGSKRLDIASDSDYSLTVQRSDGTNASYHGTGVPNGYVGPGPAGWEGKVAIAAGAPIESYEYRIPADTFGGKCGDDFGIAAYQMWKGSVGDDHGWPSNEFFDQPKTWQKARLAGLTCKPEERLHGKIAYVFRNDDVAANAFKTLLDGQPGGEAGLRVVGPGRRQHLGPAPLLPHALAGQPRQHPVHVRRLGRAGGDQAACRGDPRIGDLDHRPRIQLALQHRQRRPPSGLGPLGRVRLGLGWRCGDARSRGGSRSGSPAPPRHRKVGQVVAPRRPPEGLPLGGEGEVLRQLVVLRSGLEQSHLALGIQAVPVQPGLGGKGPRRGGAVLAAVRERRAHRLGDRRQPGGQGALAQVRPRRRGAAGGSPAWRGRRRRTRGCDRRGRRGSPPPAGRSPSPSGSARSCGCAVAGRPAPGRRPGRRRAPSPPPRSPGPAG